MTLQTHVRLSFESLTVACGPIARRSYAGLVTVAVLVALSVSLHAQTVNGTLQGRVQDSSGAMIAGAMVTAVNVATGLTRSATVSAIGGYTIDGLPAGDYTVEARKDGFQKAAKKIHLDLGSSGNLDFTLGLGQVQ